MISLYTQQRNILVNQFGKGGAYYIASRNKPPFHGDFYKRLIKHLGIHKIITSDFPYGVTSQLRTDGVHDYIFISNFSKKVQVIEIHDEELTDIETGVIESRNITLPVYGMRIYKRKAKYKIKILR